MPTDFNALWNELNARQQTYLELVYQEDQRQEKYERERAARDMSSRPADEWRWIQYDPTNDQPFPALHMALDEKKLIDPGTGSTFEALSARGYIDRKWERFPTVGGFDTVLWVQITRQGRKVVREGKGYSARKRRPKGQLSEGQWQTLEKLYHAGERGFDYASLWWPHCLRLRDYKPPLMVERNSGNALFRDYRVFISEEGQRFYETNRVEYEQLYPPKPPAPPVVESPHEIPVTSPATPEPPQPPDPVVVAVPPTTRAKHTRVVNLKEYTIICKQCGRSVTLYRYPGRAPTLCSEECIAAYTRERDLESNRERQRRFRERRKSEAE